MQFDAERANVMLPEKCGLELLKQYIMHKSLFVYFGVCGDMMKWWQVFILLFKCYLPAIKINIGDNPKNMLVSCGHGCCFWHLWFFKCTTQQCTGDAHYLLYEEWVMMEGGIIAYLEDIIT